MSDKTAAALGIYGKYVLSKADGSEVDPEACYFILRLDTDENARAAMRTYSDEAGDEWPTLCGEITACLDELERSPCGCREAHCPHDILVSRVWRHGGSND